MTWILVLELLAKSSLIAVAGLGLSAALWFRPARDRVDVLRAAVCLTVLLPVFLVVGPSLPLAWLDPAPVAAFTPAVDPQVWTVPLDPVARASLTGSLPAAPSPIAIATVIYALGVILLIGRFLIGLLTLRRWTASGKPVSREAWVSTLKALDPAGRTRLVVSDRVRSPLSWGLPPGVVLLDPECVARPASAPAVLAHELAHIRRGDWLFLALSRVVVALFWFNPLIWALHTLLGSLTEDAADAAAVAQVDRRTYARVLVDLAAQTPQPAALAMAGSPQNLARRIAHIMTPVRKPQSRPLAMTLAIGALIAVATPLAAVELTSRDQVAPPPPPPPPSGVNAPRPPAPPAPPSVRVPPPPAPPAISTTSIQSADSQYVISRNGVTRTYRSLDEMDPATRREFEQAQQEGERARQEGERARAQGEIARREGERARQEGERARIEAQHAAREARLHAAEAMREGRRAQEEGQRIAAEARALAAEARAEAQAAMIEARASMRTGAEDMARGAAEMRAEGRRLRAADYRAKVIAENRARGSIVTDAELIELSRKLPRQAEEMERSAAQMRDQASRAF